MAGHRQSRPIHLSKDRRQSTTRALFYYARVVKSVYMDEVPITVPLAEASEVPTAPSLVLAIAITAAVVIVVGFFPQVLAFFGEAARAFSS